MDQEGVVIHGRLLHLGVEVERSGLLERHAGAVAVVGLEVTLPEEEAGVLHELVFLAHDLGKGIDGLGIVAAVVAADAEDVEVAADEGVSLCHVFVEHFNCRRLVALAVGHIAQQAVSLGVVAAVGVRGQEGLSLGLDAVVTLIDVVDLHQVVERLLAVCRLGLQSLKGGLGLLHLPFGIVDVSQVIRCRHAVFSAHLLNAGEVVAGRAQVVQLQQGVGESVGIILLLLRAEQVDVGRVEPA